jgi:hypothetical protein
MTSVLLLTVAVVNFTIFPAITSKDSVAAQSPNQKKWDRRLVKSDAVPMFVYLLDRFARNVPDKTELDRAVDQAMNKGKHRRETAARLVRNFKAIPPAERQAAYGKFANPTEQSISSQQIKDTVMNSLRSARPDRLAQQLQIPDPPLRKTEKHSRSERAEPPPAPEDELRRHHPFVRTERLSTTVDEPLQIRFEGLYCREEALIDQSSNSDEIYFITEVIDVARAEAEAPPMLHPRGSHHYGDVDTREMREGPVVSIYTGPPKDVTVVVTVMEFDFGDPNHFRDEVRIATDVALAVIGAIAGGGILGAAIGAGIGELISSFINDIIDTGDDLVEASSIFLSADELANMYRQPLRERSGDRDDGRGRITINYNFHTRHNENQDADYYVLFRVHDPNLHPDLPGARAEVAPADLVVTRLETTGRPVVVGDHLEVPFLVEVRNQGVAPAPIFKVAVQYLGRSGDYANASFIVPGERDTTFPFTRAPLTSTRSTVFAGRLVLPLVERGTSPSVRAIADSCASDEFLPAHCRVRESDERNNTSRTISFTLPR